MSRHYTLIAASLAATMLAVPPAFAESERDCLLQGTVQKSEEGSASRTEVKFHSIDQYDENSKCRVRRDTKMEFKLPDDPRLKDAPDGSEVKYRYRSDGSGDRAELISVGT